MGSQRKLVNHVAAVSLYVAHYNLCRAHEALKTTPAVAIGIRSAAMVDRRSSGRGAGD
jgi:hypothetical protein